MSLRFCFTILAVAASVYLSVATDISGNAYKTERDLRRDLFSSYDKNTRPVKKASSSVPVGIAMYALKLKSMNEKDQLISLETWLKLKWTDEYLQWDPSEYDNITALQVPPTEIWRPDIALYTASPDTSLFPTAQTQAIIFNSGKVMWIPPFTMNSRCPIPLRNVVNSAGRFVDCNFRLGSWTYSGKMLDLQLSEAEVDVTNFQDTNPGWKLVKFASNRESKLYPCCVDEYPLVNFNITLKKRHDYFGFPDAE